MNTGNDGATERTAPIQHPAPSGIVRSRQSGYGWLGSDGSASAALWHRAKYGKAATKAPGEFGSELYASRPSSTPGLVAGR